MEKTVFILGAGASADAGAPVMGNFMDEAASIAASGRLPQESLTQFQLVFEAIDLLQATYAKSNLDTDNLEAVFNAFEMASFFGQLRGLDPQRVALLPDAIKHLIVKTLQLKLDLHVENPQCPPVLRGSMHEFAGQISKRFSNGNTTIITFNYDLTLEYALKAAEVDYSYALGGTSATELSVLKLHGSMNWRSAGSTIEAEPVEIVSIRDRAGKSRWHFKLSAGDSPFLVPPTLNKGDHRRPIQPVWRAAASALAEADNIIVVGFSLPPSDEFFKYLWGIGSMSKRIVRRFWVFNRDCDQLMLQRFEALLGLKTRKRFALCREEFCNIVDQLSNFESSGSLLLRQKFS